MQAGTCPSCQGSNLNFQEVSVEGAENAELSPDKCIL